MVVTGRQFVNCYFLIQRYHYYRKLHSRQFQTPFWSVPAPCNPALNCRFNNNFASGTFNFTDANHFGLDVFLGAGHNNAHLVGLGTLSGGGGGGGSVTAAEPTVLLLSGAGLVGAAVLRRSRRS